jgi:gliding motility-associated-like protein
LYIFVLQMKKLLFIFCFLLLTFRVCVAQMPTIGLTGYWPFSASMLANDSSGNGNNGAVHGATLTTDRFGNCKQAYKFNGTSNYIEVPTSPTVDMLNTDFTIAVWEKTYATDTTGAILNKNLHTGAWNGYLITTNDNDPGYCPIYHHAYFYVAAAANQEVCSDNPICQDTTWHFLTGVYKYTTNQAYFYVDNVLQSTIGLASGPISNTADLFLGGAGNVNSAYFTGVLDAIRIYQRALSAAEITQLYNEPNPGGGPCSTQICSGNLGAPTYSNNFGSGVALYGPALPAGQTQYPYITGVPVNGSYVISNNANPSNTVGYVNSADHTGNLNGYMMVVNADYPPDTVYTAHVTGLCPNTTYVFSAFIANNNTTAAAIGNCGSNYIYANVLMQVEYPPGTVQGSVSTGNLPTAPTQTLVLWQQEGFVFTTVAGQTSAEITIINNAPGGCGNDYVVDDISLSPCGPGIALSIVPNQTIFCAGDNVVLEATYTSGSYPNPQYQWQFSSNGGSTWTNIAGATALTYSINSVTAAQGGMYQLVAAENGNIGSPNCSILAGPLSFTVSSQVSINNGATTTICSSTSGDTLTAIGAATYSWSTGATTNSIVVNPSSTTSYTVVGSTGTCTSQAVSTITIVPPTSTVTISGTGTVCSGQNITLTASGANTYTWNTGVTTASTVVNPMVTTTYTVTGGIGSCTVQAVATITVVPGPILSVAGNTVVCAGQTTTLTATGANTYTWSSGQNTANLVLNPTTSSIYMVTGSDGACTAQAVATLSVNAIPIVSITGNTLACSGNNTSLTASGADTYTWSNGATTPTINFNPTTTITFTVVGAIGACTNQQLVTITVVSNLIILITGDNIICAGQKDILTASGATNYTWSTGAHTTSIIINPTVTTSYSVTGSVGTCVGQATETVVVKPSPIASYTLNPNPANTLNPLVQFLNESVNYTSWAWNFGDGSPLDTSDVNPSHYYNTQIGNTYSTSLILTNTDGCTSIDNVLLIIEPAFTFYIPNTFTPNGDGLNDLFKGEGIGIASFQIWIFDRWGACIFNSKDINKGWDGTLPGSSTPVQEGIYAWTVSIEDALQVSHNYHGTVSLIK